MAKMIKCPTCGTGIEVPPNSAGQLVKCPNCGKSLKLVARKPHASAPAAAGPGGSVAGGSVSGSSVSAMTVTGDAPSNDRRPSSYSPDDLPSLDSFCAVCGRSVEPDDLIEDNGKLVCGDCIKGARSKIDRPDGGAEMIAFKPAAYVPSKRSRLVHFTPSLLAIVLVGLVYVGCSVYLNLFPKPVGTASASLNSKKHAPVIPVITPPANVAEHQPATQPIEASTDTQTTQPVAVAPRETSPAEPATQPTPAEPQTTQPTEVALGNTPPADNHGSILFGNDGAQPLPGGVQPAQPAPAMDPLEQGMQALMDKKYDEARRDLLAAKLKYVTGKISHNILSGQQMETLEALGAAEIGARQFDDAKATLNYSYQYTPADSRTGGLVVNRLITMLMTSTSPPDFGVGITDVQHYLQSHPDDEYAATLYGTALAKAATMPNLRKDTLTSMWQFLDQYNDSLAQESANQQAHPNKLKWGTEWLPAEDVKSYRAARLQGNSISLTQAARDLEGARKKNEVAQGSLANAKQMQAAGRPVLMDGYQKNADTAAANFAAAQKAFDLATAAMHPAQWLTSDQLTPVIPETRAPDVATGH